MHQNLGSVQREMNQGIEQVRELMDQTTIFDGVKTMVVSPYPEMVLLYISRAGDVISGMTSKEEFLLALESSSDLGGFVSKANLLDSTTCLPLSLGDLPLAPED
jgi:hypothetical protein